MTFVQYVLPYASADLGDPYGATAGRANPHRGTDISPDGGGPCKAIAAGVLVSDWFTPGLGNVAVIAHADGKFSGYAHLAAESPRTIGTRIERGEAFATIGNTGTLSRGRHLHLTVATSMAGAAGGFDVLDPMAWINAHSAALAGNGPARSGLRTATAEDGEPGTIYWTKLQSELNARGWYYGPVDGVPGPATHHGHARLQAAILNELRGTFPRTSTEDDGIAGPVFWALAQRHGIGYGGIVDGIPGPNTVRGLHRLTAVWLNQNGR
jgi:murein DD-endopeptidase MepM/ murein hydrolase activator NlpD